MAADTGPAFLRLSAELLAMIAEPFFDVSFDDWDYMDDYDATRRRQLKWLRSIHPRFSYLECITKDLFTNIHLRPSFRQPDIWALKDIANIVQQVTFHPTEFYPETGGERWREQVASAASKAEMKARIAQGEREVEAIEKHIKTGPIVALYTAILRMLPNLRTIAIAGTGSHEHLTEYVLGFGESIYDSCDCTEFKSCVLSGETLFALAVRCCVSAGIGIKELKINHPDIGVGWSRLGLWKQWDLRNLTRLHFYWNRGWKLRLEEDDNQFDEDYVKWPHEEEIAPGLRRREPEASLVELLSKCAATLQEVEIGCGAVCLWPQDMENSPPPLPSLKRLAARVYVVDPSGLNDWIKASPQLERLSLMCHRRMSGKRLLKEWQPLLQTIREHPIPMQLELQLILESKSYYEWDPWTLVCDTAESVDDVRRSMNTEESEELVRVKQYLSGAIEWDCLA